MNTIRRLLWLLLACGGTPAHAHSPVPGIEGFYTGLLHPFSTPSQVLLLAGLSLLASSFPIEKARWFLVCFLVTSVAGVLLGPFISQLDPSLFAIAFIACVVAALVPGKLVTLAALFVCIGGYLIGETSIPDDGPTRDRMITMSGSIVGANLGFLYLFGITFFIRERFPKPWVAIAFRVVAAWLGAVAILMLALGFAAAPATS